MQIEDGERLLFLGSISSIAAVEENSELAVRRERDGGWEVICGPRLARDLAEDFPVGNLHRRFGNNCTLAQHLCGESQQHGRRKSDYGREKGFLHGGIICKFATQFRK